MTALSQLFETNLCSSVEDEIRNHSAWLGRISGLRAEKLLRGQKPYSYVLREGENESDYYITFVSSDLTVRHQPFIITIKQEGWCLEQGGGLGPYVNTKIDDIIHLIVHCEKEDCIPFVN